MQRHSHVDVQHAVIGHGTAGGADAWEGEGGGVVTTRNASGSWCMYKQVETNVQHAIIGHTTAGGALAAKA